MGWKELALKDIRSHKVCDEYDGLLSRSMSKVDALALYRRGIEWCIENNSPSLELLRNYREDCAFSGIFIDHHFNDELLNDNQVYIFHNCTGIIRTGLNLSKRIIPMMYFANMCDITVRCDGKADIVVPFYIFGKNNIITDGITAKIFRR